MWNRGNSNCRDRSGRSGVWRFGVVEVGRGFHRRGWVAFVLVGHSAFGEMLVEAGILEVVEDILAMECNLEREPALGISP
jgi:hypothetical protein